jgi:hypothetical protein
MYIHKLWYKTVHLPLMFAYGTCSNTKIVDKIITLRHGLVKPIEINMTGKIYNDNVLWNNKNKYNEIIKNTIATMKELFIYIHYNKNKDGSIKLPNGQKCNVSEVFDYMCISYLATHELLCKNNIYPSDMHNKNIFIHWLNDNSYYNETNIKNIKEIIYKIDDKYYKIKTFGFVIILGDTGTFIIDLKKDKFIIGHINNIQKNSIL